MTLNNTKSNQPHDDLYRAALSQVQVAKEFFAKNLPKNVLDVVDLNTLKPEKDTFLDPQLGKGAADALFSVKFCGEEGYLMLLAEHQSTSDHFMSLRLNKYKLMIWEKYRSQNPKAKHLPLLYALIYYTGKTKYIAPLDFFDLFKQPDLAKSFSTAPYHLIDLHRTPNEEIAKTVWLGVMMMVMKYAQSDNVLSRLIDMKAILKEVGGVNYLYIEAIFKYIVNQADANEIYKVIDIFKEVVSEEDRVRIMTIAERLKQEGIQLGKQEGIQLEKKHIASNMLTKGQTVGFISEVTGLPEDEIKKLQEEIKSRTH